MQTQEKRIAKLILAHINAELDETQTQELNDWLKKSESNRLYFAQLTNEENVFSKLQFYHNSNTDPIWKKTKALIAAQTDTSTIPRLAWLSVWKAKFGIAATIAILAVGMLLLYNARHTDLSSNAIHLKEVKPGIQAATLTLANGKKIKLTQANQGELAKEAGVRIVKTADGLLSYQVDSSVAGSLKYNTLSTARGETYMVILPDQSKVWLNAASSLTYAAGISKAGIRKVKLEGEAYFEIHKDKLRPFVVETKQQEVRVLGTHFNINSYGDENATKTTLLEGAVEIQNLSSKKSYLLKPGQQAKLTNKIDIANVDVDEVVSWKNGDFLFTEASLEVILGEISRWYDVDLEFKNERKKNLIMGFYLTRSSSISKVLKVLESTGVAKFTIDNNKIVIN